MTERICPQEKVIGDSDEERKLKRIPTARVCEDFNHRGWCCPWCGYRQYSGAGQIKCQGCGEVYQVPFKN